MSAARLAANLLAGDSRRDRVLAPRLDPLKRPTSRLRGRIVCYPMRLATRPDLIAESCDKCAHEYREGKAEQNFAADPQEW